MSTLKQIAEELGVSLSTVRRTHPSRRVQRVYTAEDKQRVLAMRGQSTTSIAALTGIPRTTVASWLKEQA